MTDSGASDPLQSHVEGRPSGLAAGDRHIVLVLTVVSLALFCSAARLRGGLSGDEPHYLAMAQALVKYHTIDPDQVFDNRDHWSYFPRPLEEHTVYTMQPRSGAYGKSVPLHQPGGPLLWAVPFLLLGSRGAHLFMAVISALIVTNVYYLQRQLGIVPGYAAFVAALFGIGTPVYVYASMLWIEPIGALFVLYAVRVILHPVLNPWRLLLASAALGYLPWVHGRMALFTAFLGVLLAVRVWVEIGKRSVWPYVQALGPLLVLVVVIESYNFATYGSLSPSPGISQIEGLFGMPLAQGLTFLLLDGRFGLIPHFPIFALVFPGIVLSMGRRLAPVHLVMFVVVVPYVLLLSFYFIWWGGWNPPARFLSVIAPLFSYYIAVALQRLHHWLLTALATMAGLVSFAMAVYTDVQWTQRYTGLGHPTYQPWKAFSAFLGIDVARFFPVAIDNVAGPSSSIFFTWGAVLTAFTLALWFLGRRTLQARTPEVDLPPFGRLLPERLSHRR